MKCYDCAYMDSVPTKDGRFKCLKSRKSGYELVPATMQACSERVDAFISTRDMTTRDRLAKISKEHGYYLVTALTKILNLDNSYLEAFKFFKENILIREEYHEFLLEYSELGPYLSNNLLNDSENVLFSVYLVHNYLIPFRDLINEKKYEEAYNYYFELYGQVEKRYNMLSNDIVKKKVD